jgi:hypothetical protein
MDHARPVEREQTRRDIGTELRAERLFETLLMLAQEVTQAPEGGLLHDERWDEGRVPGIDEVVPKEVWNLGMLPQSRMRENLDLAVES